ncbi:hypothetical protein SGLAD_v1c00530 [Spiroplasma gladiatoris]|uniref:Uncharacterized protein n=1 Tax=Spiroplasma gladiatoris TaxID=2143 RepID=A0A4P7AG00_9MOLU|nr:hypothetical protein [Spiroplasma gladiatoris]QBQ07254.1 hypothetical protein SGLAD_v1c00530 [Spiroplasma gladiatoris]
MIGIAGIFVIAIYIADNTFALLTYKLFYSCIEINKKSYLTILYVIALTFFPIIGFFAMLFILKIQQKLLRSTVYDYL